LVPHTISEKIIARAAGVESVRPGEIVTCKVDLAMMHDSSGPRRQIEKLEALGADVWDPDKVVVITDHFVHETDPDSMRIQEITRDWVAAKGVKRYHEKEGICHVVLPEGGHLVPGMFLVGGDSHSPTAGAFGCFMIGIGSTDLTGVLASGEIWVRVPHSFRIEVSETLPRGVAAKDVILSLCHRIGLNGANYRSVEFTGTAVEKMSVDERMVLTNMSAEIGAKTGIIAADSKTLEWLRNAGAPVNGPGFESDPYADYEQIIEIDARALSPQVAAPHSPANALPVDENAGVRIHQAYIGACTGAKLDDLRMAAEIVKGKKVARGTRFVVAPASNRIRDRAAEDGTIAALVDAGAMILPSGCGGCIGLGPAQLGENEVGISSSSRNFRGRMGAKSSRGYLGSAYTVAASALAGRIVDPREFF
jgi:3-isopropylmalate/(R)-2-methylmalate dehydratase large subunit